MMSRLLKLSEAKQREHVHLGDVSHSTHGKYDVCTFILVLCVFFAVFIYFSFDLSISEYSYFCCVDFASLLYFSADRRVVQQYIRITVANFVAFVYSLLIDVR